MRAILLKELRELRRDHRTMAMLVGMPIMLLVMFGYAANFFVDSMDVTVVGPRAAVVADHLPPFFVADEVDPTGTAADARTLLQEGRAEVVFVADGTTPTALVDGSSLFAAQSAVAVLGRMGPAVRTEVLFNPDLQTSWVMIPAIIGLILTFLGTVITSLGMVREREHGTLEQLAVMPVRPAAVILGKITPYFIVGAIDMTLITVLGVVIFDVPFNGDVAVFALGSALFLFVVLGLGVFISTVSQTAGQAIQTAFMFLLPQILLSGMIFPLTAMAAGVRWIGYLLPLTYFTMISRGVMLRGAPLDSLGLPFGVLAVMAVVVFAGATLRYRRGLGPSRRQRRAAEASGAAVLAAGEGR